jgi:hypothetical protein
MAERNPYKNHVMVVRPDSTNWRASMWDEGNRDIEGSIKHFVTYEEAMAHANTMGQWFSIPVVSRYTI